MSPEIIIFGTGEVSDIVSVYFESFSNYKIIAYTIDGQFIKNQTFRKKPIVPFEEIHKVYSPKNHGMFIALGYHNLNKLRKDKYIQSKKKGYKLVSFIHPKSNILNTTKFGDNSLILDNQSIQPFASIGSNCFIWSGVLIAHHVTIGDHCWITSEASVAGHSNIGESSFIGINATIGHMVNIGNQCFIGANTLITKNADDKSVFIQKDTDLFRLNSDQFIKFSKMR